MTTEKKKRNGFYFMPDGKQDPSVTTVLGSVGSSFGLTKWAAKLGSYGAYRKMVEDRTQEFSVEEIGEIGQAALAHESRRVTGIGTRVHNAIEAYILKKELIIDTPLSENEKLMLKTFTEFYEDVGFEPVAVEAELYSNKYRYAGRIDLINNMTKKNIDRIKPYLIKSKYCDDLVEGLCVTDFKTGNLYIEELKMQLGAYAPAFLELPKNKDKQIVNGLGIQIARDNPTQIKCIAFNQTTLIDAFENGFLPAYKVWKYMNSPVWWNKQYEE